MESLRENLGRLTDEPWDGGSCPFADCGAEARRVQVELTASWLTEGDIGFRATCDVCERSWRLVAAVQAATGFCDAEGEDLAGLVVVEDSLLSHALRAVAAWEQGDLASAVHGLQMGCESVLEVDQAGLLIELLADDPAVPLTLGGSLESQEAEDALPGS